MKTCKCKVCMAFKAQKIKVYGVVWDQDHKFTDYYFLAIGKTKRQFEAALKKARQAVAERQPTVDDCFVVFSNALSEAGFIGMDDISCSSTVFIDVDPPEIPGATVSFDKVY